MSMRERHGGKLLWTLNLVVLGAGGVLLIPLATWCKAMEEHKEGVEIVL
jgi:hypothetical protein